MSHPLAGKSVWFIPLTGSPMDGCVTTEDDARVTRICVFATERAAMLEIADHVQVMIEDFKAGDRDDFSTEEWPIEGQINEDGHILDATEWDWGLADTELEIAPEIVADAPNPA